MFDYDNYVYQQTVRFSSHEDEHSVWASGQIRFLDSIISLFPEGARILDVGCGNGISLEKLNSLGYAAVGIDFNEEKLDVARSKGCSVYNCDMHEMYFFEDKSFDVVISSHSLEHSYNPSVALSEFHRVLPSNGLLFIVVPFPDVADYAIDAHVGRDILGTSDPTNGDTKFLTFLNRHGFLVTEMKTDSYREPELWAFCKKI